jgi:2-polyprenyl-3-methyl-5-hydroxy-6-metoxy-1,4-benzoquinol methylase
MLATFESLARRRREEEWIDAPDADPKLLRKSLSYIRWINRLLGYTRATISHLDRFSRHWKAGEIIRILDVATGSADIPRAILHWANKKGFEVRIVGVDLHPGTASEAAASIDDSRFAVFQADALKLPFADDSFDYAITNMFLHHLDDDQIVSVLKNMSQVARRGIVAADLIRNRRAYFWIKLFTLLANPMVKHDAPVSVAQAFTRPEVLSLRDQAGVGFASYYSHFGHRFVLAGEKAA